MTFYRLHLPGVAQLFRKCYLKNLKLCKKFSNTARSLIKTKGQLEVGRNHWEYEWKSVSHSLSMLPRTGWTEIFECKTSKELLSLASRRSCDWKFDPNEYVYLFNHLEDIIYNEEVVKIPSLYILKTRRDYVYSQLYFRSDMRERVFSIIDTPELNQLLASLESDIERLDVDCLPYLLTSMAHLGIATSNHAFVKGVFRILDKPEFSWVDFLFFSRITIGNRRIFLAKYVIPKFHLLINSDCFGERSREMLFCLVSFLDLSRYSSLDQSNVTKSLETIASLSTKEMFIDTAIAFKSMEMVFHLLNDYNRIHLLDQNYPLLRKIALCAIECLSQQVHRIPLPFYGVILNYTKNIYHKLFSFDYHATSVVYNTFYHTLLNHIASIIPTDDVNIMDIIFSLYNFMFTKVKGLNYMEKVDEVFLTWLRNRDLDVVTIVDFASAYRYSKNPKMVVVHELKKLLVERIDLIREIEKLHKTTAFFNVYSKPLKKFSLSTIPYQQQISVEEITKEDPYRVELRSKLIYLFNNEIFTTKQICLISCGIITLSKGLDIPDSVIDKLHETIPSAKTVLLESLISVLMPEVQNENVHPSYKKLWDAVMDAFMKRKKDRRHFTSLARVISLHFKKGGTGNEETLAEILDCIEIPHDMSIFDFEQFLRDLTKLKYYNEKLLKKLESIVIKNAKNLSVIHLIFLLKHMSQVDYEIQDSQFVEACEEILEEGFDQVNTHQQLLVIQYMVNLRAIPEKFVAKIFSLEYFRNLDTVLKGMSKRMQYMIKRQFQDLNRCLVIDSPELNIPWVMRSFIDQPYIKDRKGFEHRKACEEIENVLHHIVGGRDYYRSDVISPYCYKTDFEVYFDKLGLPVPYKSVRQTNRDSFKRVAVMYLFRSLYCMNNKRLIGSSRKKINHLEMTGYHVVQVPFYEWNSEALRSKESKIEYLRNKMNSS